MVEKPTFIFFKKAEKEQNRIIIPQICIDKFGSNFYMEIYPDYIKLVPAQEEEKKEK